MRALFVVPAIIVTTLAGLAARAEICTVTSTADSGAGTLRECIDRTPAGGEIRFDPALDGRKITVGGPIRVVRNLKIIGRGPTQTEVGGEFFIPDVLWVSLPSQPPTLSIEGLSIVDGRRLLNGNGVVQVSHSVLPSIFNDAGTMVLTDSVVTGGLGVRNLGTMTIRRCTLSRNEDVGAGGIFNKGKMTVSDTTITENRSGIGWGAGIANQPQGELTVINSTISNNFGSLGTGIFNVADMTVITSTITGNEGVALFTAGEKGVSRFVYSIVAGNNVDCRGNAPIAVGLNLDGSGSCRFRLTADPLLGPLSANGGPTQTHDLLEGSPAIDAVTCCVAVPGTGMVCSEVDQRGTPRPVDGDLDGVALCDLGAVERVPAAFGWSAPALAPR